jgi:uncharacterized membrane protein YccC
LAPAKAPTPPPAPRDLRPGLKLAAQTACAVGLAAALGAAHSAATWSWAAFAAFIVFAGTTRGDALRRVAQRLGGTAVGIVLGFVVAHFAKSRDAALLAIFAAIFVGIYATRVSYFIATTAFTIMVAVLYQRMGRLNDGIMLLRLEQTLVGVACGAAAALFVFPVFTRGAIGAATAKLLRSVAAALEAHDPQLARAFDRDFQALRVIAGPMVARLPFGSDRPAAGLLCDVSALVHYTRLLTAAPDAGDAQARTLGRELADEAAARAAAIEASVQTLRRPGLVHAIGPRPAGDASPRGHWAQQYRLLLARIEARFEAAG